MYERPPGGKLSHLRASGRIVQVHKTRRVLIAPSKPFWAPWPTANRVTLLPTQVKFVFVVSFATKITVDGKKAKFGQLAQGQYVDVEYYVNENAAYGISVVDCYARRIDVRTSAPTEAGKSR
jgi:hypothetical protein